MNKIIPYIIIIASFVISRAHYFINAPLVGFHPDSAVYFMAIEGAYYGELPKLGIVPPLYPIFLYLSSLLSNNLFLITILQTSISLLASIFLIFAIQKTIGKSLFYAIAISLFYISSHALAFDSMIITESLFVSSLLVVLGLFLLSFSYNRKSYWTLLSLALLVPILLRPTAIFFVGFFFVFLIYLYAYKKAFLLSFLLPFISVIFLVMVYHSFTIKQPIPNRLLSYTPWVVKNSYNFALSNYQGKDEIYTSNELTELNRKADSIRQKLKSEEKFYNKILPLKILVFMNSISYESRSFYGYELPRRCKMFFQEDFLEKNYHGNFLTIRPFGNEFKEIMFRNYLYELPSIKVTGCNAIKDEAGVITKMYLWFYDNIYMKLIRTKLLVLLVFASIFLLAYSWFKKKSFTLIHKFTLLHLSILLLSALVIALSPHNEGSWRYTYPTEFIYFLNLVSVIQILIHDNYLKLKNAPK